MHWLVLTCLLSVAFLLRPVRCSSVRIEPSIAAQPWESLEEKSCTVGSCVSVQYALYGRGFHRTLRANLWKEEEEGEDVAYVITLNITADVYVDLDQVSQLVQFEGLQVVASGYIDTERPASAAQHHLLLVYVDMRKERAEVEIPVHFRYLATGSTPYSTVTLPTPLLLSRTSHDRHAVTLPCSTTSSSHCHWHLPPLTPHPLTPSLQARLPLGQRGHVTIVAIVTVIVTLASTFYLMHTIACH